MARLIDADALLKDNESYLCKPCKEKGHDYHGVACRACWVDDMRIAIEDAPTVDAVEVDVVAQMLFDAFGDSCPCNYNGNDEWLPFVCDDGNACVKHDDPLYCWKQYIKHYGERKDNG